MKYRRISWASWIIRWLQYRYCFKVQIITYSGDKYEFYERTYKDALKHFYRHKEASLAISIAIFAPRQHLPILSWNKVNKAHYKRNRFYLPHEHQEEAN